MPETPFGLSVSGTPWVLVMCSFNMPARAISMLRSTAKHPPTTPASIDPWLHEALGMLNSDGVLEWRPLELLGIYDLALLVGYGVDDQTRVTARKTLSQVMRKIDLWIRRRFVKPLLERRRAGEDAVTDEARALRERVLGLSSISTKENVSELRALVGEGGRIHQAVKATLKPPMISNLVPVPMIPLWLSEDLLDSGVRKEQKSAPVESLMFLRMDPRVLSIAAKADRPYTPLQLLEMALSQDLGELVGDDEIKGIFSTTGLHQFILLLRTKSFRDADKLCRRIRTRFQIGAERLGVIGRAAGDDFDRPFQLITSTSTLMSVPPRGYATWSDPNEILDVSLLLKLDPGCEGEPESSEFWTCLAEVAKIMGLGRISLESHKGASSPEGGLCIDGVLRYRQGYFDAILSVSGLDGAGLERVRDFNLLISTCIPRILDTATIVRAPVED